MNNELLNHTTEELLAEVTRRNNELSKYTPEELANELASRKGVEELKCEEGGTYFEVAAPNTRVKITMAAGLRIVLIPEGDGN